MDIDSILAELAIELGLPSLALSNSGTCSIMIDEKMKVDLEANETRDIVRIIGNVNALASIVDTEQYKSFLEANLSSLEGNIRFAIDSRARELIMFTQLDMLHVDANEFKTILESFVNELEEWLKKVGNSDIQRVDSSAQNEEISNAMSNAMDENPFAMKI